MIFGACAAIFAFWWIGVADIFYQVAVFGWLGFAVFLGSLVLMHIFATLGWMLITRSHNYHIGFTEAFKAMLMDFPVSFLTPSMYIGGEPVRCFFVSQHHKYSMSALMGTALLSRFQELWGILILIFIGSMVALPIDAVPLSAKIVIISVDSILAFLLVWSIRRFYKGIPIFCAWVDFFIRHGIFPKFFTKYRPKVENTEKLMVSTFRDKEHRFALIHGFLLNMGSVFFMFVKPLIFFAFLYGGRGEWQLFFDTFTFPNLLLIFALTQLLMALQITPGCLGIFEGGVPMIFAIIGVPSEEAFAFVLISRLGDALIAAMGIMLIFHYGLERFLIGGKGAEECEEKKAPS